MSQAVQQLALAAEPERLDPLASPALAGQPLSGEATCTRTAHFARVARGDVVVLVCLKCCVPTYSRGYGPGLPEADAERRHAGCWR